MTTGILQETMQVSPQGASARFRPYASPNHHVTKGRYITSNDPRGYIPVYEYPLNGQWIMMDIDDGYILWTGIWKALGHSKADIVKMVDSQPDLAPLIRRVRGGYLKIQGTWMPYEVALRLSRRVAWTIRDELVPLFGPTFPSTCLSPDQPGYGQVVAGHNRRRARRGTQATVYSTTVEPAKWNTVKDTSSDDSKSDSRRPLPIYSPYPSLQEQRCEFNMDIDTFPPTLPCSSGRRPCLASTGSTGFTNFAEFTANRTHCSSAYSKRSFRFIQTLISITLCLASDIGFGGPQRYRRKRFRCCPTSSTIRRR
ncbi:DNA-binding domain of Mlu1-box binding protein MBP1 [Armillaria solidipes]|uniref:DNA-binding domain of Mlu1-box binding protein MBP1 n=1 Tax=Armillaria solidipes TaxID=1076256 RepID=A0A2H3BTG8_9AGAR|nr:DNA-binding domain of Mlu1-box binding protein MBP1 [Armillaria solidipes]